MSRFVERLVAHSRRCTTRVQLHRPLPCRQTAIGSSARVSTSLHIYPAPRCQQTAAATHLGRPLPLPPFPTAPPLLSRWRPGIRPVQGRLSIQRDTVRSVAYQCTPGLPVSLARGRGNGPTLSSAQTRSRCLRWKWSKELAVLAALALTTVPAIHCCPPRAPPPPSPPSDPQTPQNQALSGPLSPVAVLTRRQGLLDVCSPLTQPQTPWPCSSELCRGILSLQARRVDLDDPVMAVPGLVMSATSALNGHRLGNAW